MIPLLPAKKFDELKNKLTESETYHFYWDDMVTNDASYEDLLKYLKNCDNVKYISEGSARVAFYLQSGAYDTSLIPQPTCLKVAKNEKGIAQNHVEIETLNRFYDKFSCFPKIYDWDGDDDKYLLMEVGKPFKEIGDERAINNYTANYFNEWNRKFDSLFSTYSFFDRNKIDLRIIDFKDISTFMEDMYGESVKAGPWFAYKAEILEAMDKIAGTNKKYRPFADLFRWLNAGGKESVEIGDFGYYDNFAMITRENDECLVPIDFGLNIDVAKEYY